MIKIINDIEQWLTSEDQVKIAINNYVENFQLYPYEKDMFFYGENVAREKIIRNCLYYYFKKIEEYVALYVADFSFSKYNNFEELANQSDNDGVVYLLKWLKEENIHEVKNFVQRANEVKYDSEFLVSIIRYYDFLIRDSMETDNHEATLDFLVEFFYNIMTKSEEFSDKNLEGSPQKLLAIQLDTKEVDINTSIESIVDENEQVPKIQFMNDIKSANEQTFSLKNLFH